MPRILAADIGGTHSRFGYFEAEPGLVGTPRLLDDMVRLRTDESVSFPALLARLFAEPRPFAPADCDLVALAVAGPVRGGVCRPPNIAWGVDVRDLAGGGFKRSALLNDFVAQAYACRSEAVVGAEVIQPGRPDPGGVVAVVGAGTGLGHCALLPDGCGGLLAVPSEGGHMAFAFVGEAENAYGEHLRRTAGLPYCHGDAVVTGSGLARLHSYLSGVDTGPMEVEARLGDAPETVAWFARFYGRVARNYALAVLATGGLYVAGGVAARNPRLLRHPAFLAEFVTAPSASHADLLASVPVLLNANQFSGVYGAALYGMQLLRRG
jgi:glucokinase